ncbi:MAG: hypothetical protein HN413_06965 [Chloroflexi bacterium]|nr:hypothetical protein [Chloroflexota bacterium]
MDRKPVNGTRRTRWGLGLVMIGFLLFLLGIEPNIVGADRSPVVGFVQIAVFEIGIAIICLGGFLCLSINWDRRERTIAEDIGLRLVSTGYVIAITSGMADVFGFGSQPWPVIPYFGEMQAVGVILGEAVIAIGFLLMVVIPQKISVSPPLEKPKIQIEIE